MTTPTSLRATENSDPFAFYDALREQGPLVWDEEMQGWLVSTYEECKYILSNENLFRHPYADADETLIRVKGGRRNITVVLGEEHAAIRQFILQSLSPRNVQLFADRIISPITEHLIAAFKHQGRAELFAQFCSQLPCRVLMVLFGIEYTTEAELRHIMALHNTIMHWAGGRHFLGPEATEQALAASAELNALLLPVIRDRRQHPGDDLISKLWQEAPDMLPGATEDDILANCRELFLGGSDTTVQALANGLYLLLSQPRLCEEVCADSGKALDNFIEEVIRLLPSVHYRYRIANQDIEVGGTTVKKDQVLFTLNAAANRDPAHYHCPAQVDLNRERPRDHLGFNAGPRMCVGVALARMELKVAFTELLRQLPELRFDPNSPPPAITGFFQRYYAPLNVIFEVD